MNIRPKIPIFQLGGLPSTVTWSDPTSTWFTRSGIGILEGTYNMLKPLYDKWKSSGSLEDYLAYKKAVDNLNENQRYGYAPGHLKYLSNNNTLFKNSTVGAWQNYVRNNYNFINDSIGKNYKLYHIVSSNPNSGDNPKTGWKTDNLWAGETDDRTTWGNLLNSNDDNYLKWKLKFSEIGIDYRTNPEWNTGDALYGFLKSPEELKSLNNPPSDTIQLQLTQKQNGVRVGAKDDTPNDFWSKLLTGFKNIAPDLLDALRLAGNMHNNERVYNESMKAIIPNLLLSYHTYRQVVGDEATKLAYYRRAVQGQTKAGLPFTSDADRLMAYMQEARRIGDELRAQGDLADNQRIRETSAEAAAHADANIERDTTIANQNITELNKAAAAKHQLTAQKYSADWTNIDLYLLGLQARLLLKRNEEKELEKQLLLLNTQENLLGNTQLRTYREEADKAWEAYNDPKVTDVTTKEALKKKYEEAIKTYQLYKIHLAKENIRQQRYGIYSAKSGTKITKKDTTDKYLYRTSRDIVEHFRRMSKMTDDSRIRTMPKAAKMPSHPKKKLLLGGVAPFTVYRPLEVGGETTTQVSLSTDGTSKSTKDTTAKDKLDMIKELFKQVQGLPIDVSQVYQHMVGVFNKARAFGEEMTSDDIAAMYLNSMNEIARLKYSLKAYEDARNVAVANDAMNEIAVGINGEIALYDSENLLVKRGTLKQLNESDGKLMPLTNGQLLTMRAHSPNLAFDDLVFDIVNNGIGMSKIASHIKSIAGTIGSMESKIEGISEVEAKKVKNGLQILAGTADTPDGFYKVTNDTKDSSANVKAALNYIYNILPKNYKTILELNSNGNGQLLIYNMLVSLVSDFLKQDITPLTGKVSDKGLGSGGTGDISSNPLLAMLREIGGMYLNYSLVTKDSNTKLSVNGTFYSLLPKISEDMSIDKMLSVSGIGGIIQGKRGITFGNLEIKPEDLKHIMYSNNGGMVVTLPCKIVNGIKLVNLDVVETYEKAEQKALQVNSDRNSPQFIQALALELKNEHLDSLLDSNGLPNKNMFGQFLVVEAYTSDKIKFDTNSKYVEKIENPDEELELRMSKTLSTDNKKSDYTLDVKDHWTIFEGTWDDIYKGTVFIPLNNNPNAALNTWGNSAKIGQTTELEELYLISNKSSKFNGNNTLE